MWVLYIVISVILQLISYAFILAIQNINTDKHEEVRAGILMLIAWVVFVVMAHISTGIAALSLSGRL